MNEKRLNRETMDITKWIKEKEWKRMNKKEWIRENE